MDASQSALDSLRTVEFRETLKGYHRDDVDEYLEKAAVEAEGLQEQLRQSGERLRQAAERISQLETQLEQQPAPVAQADPAVPDDTLQRTPPSGPEVRRRDQGRLRGPGRPRPRRGRRQGPPDHRVRPVPGQSGRRRVRAAPARGDRPAGGLPGPPLPRGRDDEPAPRGGAEPSAHRPQRDPALGGRERAAGHLARAGPSPQDQVAPAPAAAPNPGAGGGPVVQGGNHTVPTPQPAPAPNRGTGPSGEVTQMRPAGATTAPAGANAPIAH